MKILSIQMRPKIYARSENLKKVETFLQNFSQSPDLVVLPEFFSTGISHKAFVELAEEENSSETLEFLKIQAKKYNTNIVAGSIIEKEAEKFFNTTFVLNRDGKIVGKYRKINLFNCFGGNEGELITRGNKIVTCDLDIGPIGLAICFDIRYPLHFDCLRKQGAKIFVLPTAFLEFVENDVPLLKDVFLSLNKARATENLAYFVSANQTGKIDSKRVAIGNSAIVNPLGKVVSESLDEKEGVIFADIDLDLVDTLRKDVFEN